MLKKLLLAAAAAAILAPAGQALAIDGLHHVSIFHAGHSDRYAMSMARSRAWHGNYFHTMTGHPIPLVVPPTANMQTRWAWGVSQSTMTPIYHQFKRPYPGVGGSRTMNGFRPTPLIRSNTDQFGTYYVRGPW